MDKPPGDAPGDPTEKRPTDRPPRRPSTRRWVQAGASSEALQSAQDALLAELRRGALSAVALFFDGAVETVRGRLLTFGLDLYNSGIARGRAMERALFTAYLDVLDAKHAAVVGMLDARVEAERPAVRAAEVAAALRARRVDATDVEVAEGCRAAGIPLAED